MQLQSRHLQATILTLVAVVAHAQTPPTVTPEALPLADYLGLLEQIAPAARHGAEAYLGAYRQRCGRAMTTDELRAAVSKDGGERTLMAMIRASQLQDARSIAALSRSVSCRGQQ
jgi:hypothetical protein